MNMFHLYDDGHVIVIRANMTKKQLAEVLKEYAVDNDRFRPIKFRNYVRDKGYKFYYDKV